MEERNFNRVLTVVHEKRRSADALTHAEFVYLLADCILDGRFFQSPHWNWRYGGARYVPFQNYPIKPTRILVVQWPGALGDVAMAAPALSILRQKYPRSEIRLLSSRAGMEVFSENRDVDVIIENPLDLHLQRNMEGKRIDYDVLLTHIAELVTTLKESRYDVCVNLQVLPVSAVLTRLSEAKTFLGMSLSDDGIPIIYGNTWAPYLFGVSANLMRRHNRLHRTEIFQLMIDDAMYFSPSPHFHINEKAVEKAQSFFNAHYIKDEDTVVGIHPLAGTPIRCWPRFDQLARKILDETKAKVIFFGTESEKGLLDEIVRRTGAGAIKATHFDLQTFMAALSGCDLMITNDTGPMHLACLLKKKVLSLFGPTSFYEVGPWQTDYHIIQTKGCRNCFEQTCARPDMYCMDQIESSVVFKVAKRVLDNKPIKKIDKSLTYVSANDKVSTALPNQFRNDIFRYLIQEETNPTERTRPGIPPGIPGHVFHECRSFQAILQKAMACLARAEDDTTNYLQILNQQIFSANSLFKPFAFLNDLKFLDKRKPLQAAFTDYEMFYQALLEDIHKILDLEKPSPR